MNISKRLLTIANMVNDNYNVIDVGCDHALLDIYLTINKNINCTAIDNKEKVLEYSKKNIQEYNLENKIKLLLNDGLDNISITGNDIVILAGLGTKTILNIIKNKNIKHLIVQSNDDIYFLRKSLMQLGFKVVDEQIIYEKRKYYTVIKLVKEKIRYSKKELEYGPILLQNNSKVFVNYLNGRKKHFQDLLVSIPNKCLLKKFKIMIKIKKLEAILK